MPPAVLIAVIAVACVAQPGLVLWLGVMLRKTNPGVWPKDFVVRQILAPLKVEAGLLFVAIVTAVTDLLNNTIPSWVWWGLVAHFVLQAAAWAWVVPAAKRHFGALRHYSTA